MRELFYYLIGIGVIIGVTIESSILLVIGLLVGLVKLIKSKRRKYDE